MRSESEDGDCDALVSVKLRQTSRAGDGRRPATSRTRAASATGARWVSVTQRVSAKYVTTWRILPACMTNTSQKRALSVSPFFR
jgi:hypothetical protein